MCLRADMSALAPWVIRAPFIYAEQAQPIVNSSTLVRLYPSSIGDDAGVGGGSVSIGQLNILWPVLVVDESSHDSTDWNDSTRWLFRIVPQTFYFLMSNRYGFFTAAKIAGRKWAKSITATQVCPIVDKNQCGVVHSGCVRIERSRVTNGRLFFQLPYCIGRTYKAEQDDSETERLLYHQPTNNPIVLFPTLVIFQLVRKPFRAISILFTSELCTYDDFTELVNTKVSYKEKETYNINKPRGALN